MVTNMYLSVAVTDANSRSAALAVTNTVGNVALEGRLMQDGIGTNVAAEATTWVPRLPAASPNTN